MDIADWIRRLFGRPSAAVPCSLCHRSISPGDLLKGVAVIVARRHYCGRCVHQITGPSKDRSQLGWSVSADTGSSSTIFVP